MDLLRYPADQFVYRYLAGPVVTAAELDSDFEEGNCRLALQLYFYRIHNLFFPREAIYLPGGYKTWGKFCGKGSGDTSAQA